jgi:hypothetical protein
MPKKPDRAAEVQLVPSGRKRQAGRGIDQRYVTDQRAILDQKFHFILASKKRISTHLRPTLKHEWSLAQKSTFCSRKRTSLRVLSYESSKFRIACELRSLWVIPDADPPAEFRAATGFWHVYVLSDFRSHLETRPLY